MEELPPRITQPEKRRPVGLHQKSLVVADLQASGRWPRCLTEDSLTAGHDENRHDQKLDYVLLESHKCFGGFRTLDRLALRTASLRVSRSRSTLRLEAGHVSRNLYQCIR